METRPIYTRTGRHLGQGGYGSVDEVMVVHNDLLFRGAVKTVPCRKGRGHPSLIEAHIMACIKSPYLASAWDISLNAEHMTILMPRAIGDLRTISRTPKLAMKTRLRWMWETCLGVQELHRRGIVHGDIKASNVLLYGKEDEEIEKGHCQLADFSCACVIGNGDLNGVSLGRLYTSTHRPPEVWEEREWGYAADIWALGCTLYEMMTGNYLFAIYDPKDPNDINKIYLEAKEAFYRYHTKPIARLGKMTKLTALIVEMLMLNPSHRPSIDQVLSHPAFAMIRCGAKTPYIAPHTYCDLHSSIRCALTESLKCRLQQLGSLLPISEEVCERIARKLVYKVSVPEEDGKTELQDEERRIVTLLHFHLLPT